MSESHTTPTTDEQRPVTIENTADTAGTEFRERVLYAIAGLDDDKEPYGLAIKEVLEAYYGESINNGRLYPNLDTLAEEGFIDRSAIDKRTNKYELTDRARQFMLSDIAWKATQLGLAAEEAEHREWSA